jgi:hypothetical protein
MKLEILKIRFRRFASRYLSKVVYIFYSINFKFYNFKKKPPVIILTPGKVGSSSVYRTLKKKFNKNYIFHIHNLSEQGIKKSIHSHLNSDRKSLPLHLLISKLLYKKLIKFEGELNIITLIREPISREISGFFQNIDFHKNELEGNNLVINECETLKKINKILPNSHISVTNWINTELINNLEIDIYNDDFSSNTGFKIFHNNGIKLLLIRMEDLNFSFKGATMNFFDLEEGIKLKDYNIGEEKYYSRQYKSLRNKIKLSNENIDKILSSKYVIHFYGDYVDKIINKYSN